MLNFCLMDIHQLKVFTAVYRYKSFSKASEVLYLSQPTISEHIKNLEEELGCQLFDRLGRHIEPTANAKVLYKHALDLIERANKITTLLKKTPKKLSGDITIGASTTPSTYILPTVIAQMTKKYSNLTFNLVVNDSFGVIEQILDYELYLGIVGSKNDDKRLIFRKLLRDELIVISSPALVDNDELSIDEFIKMPFVFRERGSGTRQEIENQLINLGIILETLKINGVFGSTEAIKQAVKAELGISIVSKIAVIDELKYGLLKELKISNLCLSRYFYLVYHSKRTLPPNYTMFVQELLGITAKPDFDT